MRIGAVASAANVSEQTLRYYERAGLLEPPKRSPNGYRDYGDDAVVLVRFIKRAQELGFSLDEARNLARLRGARSTSCQQVQQLAAEKIAEIERRIADLDSLRTELRGLVSTCHENPAPACPMLDALDADAAAHPAAPAR